MLGLFNLHALTANMLLPRTCAYCGNDHHRIDLRISPYFSDEQAEELKGVSICNSCLKARIKTQQDRQIYAQAVERCYWNHLADAISAG